MKSNYFSFQSFISIKIEKIPSYQASKTKNPARGQDFFIVYDIRVIISVLEWLQSQRLDSYPSPFC
jgi:hypothetical protein